MKIVFRCAVGWLLVLGTMHGAPTFEEAMKRAAVDYRERAHQAAAALGQTRARVAGEKAPLLQQLRAAEDRMVAAESETTRLETQREDSTEQRRKILKALETIRQTTTYARSLAHDSLKAAVDQLAPGEDQLLADRLATLQKQLEAASGGAEGGAALDVADFLCAHTEQALGGYRAEGAALVAETGQVVRGTFAFVGPDAYFLPASNDRPGTLRPREGAKHPISYAIPDWKPAEAKAFFAGQPATFAADASGGKALRLDQTRGTLWQHVRKGGAVAFAIVIVGIFSALMILQKARDVARLRVDSPAAIEGVLTAVAHGDLAAAERAAATLNRSARELLEEGLRHADQSKTMLEERLQAVLLALRLEAEHRLPFLAVIATAAPLMGLLGTVVGMVKTFALITVFGTGNAGKLSSGISEVLVATELGLAVAIPTLVAHGFFAQRIQRNLALLERYALKFMSAVESGKVRMIDNRDEPVSA